MSINDYHGGAIENCALQLGHIIERADRDGLEVHHTAELMVEEMKRNGRRMSGFGHRVHDDDPRTRRLFELAEAAGVAGRHIETARSVERVFASAGKRLPINVDGAIGAILADMGFDSRMMNGLFMIARLPGLVAHVTEEKQRQKPMRRIDPTAHTYDGPAARSLTQPT